MQKTIQCKNKRNVINEGPDLSDDFNCIPCAWPIAGHDLSEDDARDNDD